MKKVVISQPMLFPWVGLFEQIRLADVYVHYDDVQLPQGRGGFISRVQIKTHHGIQWLTVPVLRKGKRLQLIEDVMVDSTQKWREKHIETLRCSYSKAPFFDEMLALAESVYSLRTRHLSELNIYAIEKIAEYFGISCCFLRSSNYNIQSSSSEKLLQLVLRLNGTVYITGHGARNYLDHELFEKAGVSVQYMQYRCIPYPQQHGAFTPYVTALDLIANCGREGRRVILSDTVEWKKFIEGSDEQS